MQSTISETESSAAPVATAELVRRSQAGDAAAFETLYREHCDRIYAVCLRLSGDSQQAAELTQDVFVRAWSALAGFRGEAAFGTWLHRIAFNVVRQSQRSEKRRHSRIEIREDVEPIGQPTREPDRGDMIDLERAIAQLPPRARNALVLHDIHGYRCREVAEITGTAVGTIQAHLHRARKLLKEILEK
ncbi:MAG: RNA polymerase sigma factor [Gemmatimonadota bacterium]